MSTFGNLICLPRCRAQDLTTVTAVAAAVEDGEEERRMEATIPWRYYS